MRSPGFGTTTALFLAALFLGIGIHQPFFPVWLQSRGLTATEIAIVLAAPLIRVVATPVIAFLADRTGERRRPIIILCAATLAGFAAYTIAAGFWPILIVSILMAIVWPSIIPLAEAAVVGGSIDRGIDYGRVRLWGSLAFIAGSIGTGFVVGGTTVEAVIWLLIAAQVLMLAAAGALPVMPVRERQDHDDIGMQDTEGKAVLGFPHPAPLPTDVARLFRGAEFPLLLAASGLTQAAHAMYYAFGAIHWRSLAIDDGTIGLLWATGVGGEVALFAFSGQVLRFLGPAGLIVIGATAAAVRWAITACDPPLGILVTVQTLHGLTFGATHLGTVHFIVRAVPRSLQATAQGVHSALATGILMSGSVMLCGPAYAALGGLTYLIMCSMAVVAVGCALGLHRLWDGATLRGFSPRGQPEADA